MIVMMMATTPSLNAVSLSFGMVRLRPGRCTWREAVRSTAAAQVAEDGIAGRMVRLSNSDTPL
jgi:hypothetical protein